MQLLLDTHIWLWAFREPHRLSSEVHRAITEPSNSRFLSPISIWETILLLEKRKIVIHDDFGQFFDQTRSELDLQEAALDWRVMHEVRFVMLGYKDPADRFLVATARAYDLTLVTADERLLRVPDLKTLANA
ncbi:MAG: type II toxin-antitoxin system VapC family toxin [Candidatus Acidiferrum sp.]